MIKNDKIGKQIALLRKEKGMTGEGLAEILGVSPQAISKWENGKCLPETAILPMLSTALGCSIDTLLMPKELLILSAVYSDGVKYMDATQTVNALIKNNSLNLTINSQFLGISIDSERVKVLTIKYQTPKGIFYDFAAENAPMLINLVSEKYSIQCDFQIVGAYYGNSENYRCAMEKIRHYDYFHWKEIRANHESFPSSTATDDTEFLSLIYINKKGIFVVSCEENESICYSSDRTSMYLKDTSACILPNIMTLEWEKGMDCTWAGAVYAALKYMGEEYTYEQLMGMSGACYRIAFTEVWDWSAVDALVAFDYSTLLFSSIGYEQLWAERIDKGGRKEERKRIMEDINSGKPVIAINLRIAPEWGVITGYKENGKCLLCRTYFDKEYLNENNDYLETDFWPFLITHFGDEKEKPSAYETLITSLRTLYDSFYAPCRRGYFQGKEAYEKWINGLENSALWDTNLSKKDVDRRLSVNDSMILNLIDARRCAAIYLKESAVLFEEDIQKVLCEVADRYFEIVQKLAGFRERLKQSESDELHYNVITTKNDYSVDFRQEQVYFLKEILEYENDIVLMTRNILDTIEGKTFVDM